MTEDEKAQKLKFNPKRFMSEDGLYLMVACHIAHEQINSAKSEAEKTQMMGRRLSYIMEYMRLEGIVLPDGVHLLFQALWNLVSELKDLDPMLDSLKAMGKIMGEDPKFTTVSIPNPSPNPTDGKVDKIRFN